MPAQALRALVPHYCAQSRLPIEQVRHAARMAIAAPGPRKAQGPRIRGPCPLRRYKLDQALRFQLAGGFDNRGTIIKGKKVSDYNALARCREIRVSPA